MELTMMKKLLLDKIKSTRVLKKYCGLKSELSKKKNADEANKTPRNLNRKKANLEEEKSTYHKRKKKKIRQCAPTFLPFLEHGYAKSKRLTEI